MLKETPSNCNEQIFFASLDSLVPQDHILRLINKYFDWSFIYELTQEMYCHDFGRPAVDPVLLIKIIFLQYIENLGSIRNTLRQTQTNVAYRFFLGIGMFDKLPHPSTVSKTYSRRFKGTSLFRQIFEQVLERLKELELIDLETVFVDSTHVKAHANPHKYVSAFVKDEPLPYEKELLEEVNAVRKKEKKKELLPKEKPSQFSDEDYDPDSVVAPGVSKKTKEWVRDHKHKVMVLDHGRLVEAGKIHVDLKDYSLKKVSKTDCLSGWFHKGEHKHVFAFAIQAACDKNNYILAYSASPGNHHDSRSFFTFSDQLIDFRPSKIVLDAGYKKPPVARELYESGITPLFPYTVPMTKKGFYKKKEYEYDSAIDTYICPRDNLLSYKRTRKEGYKIYWSDPKTCRNCPDLFKCTESASHRKVIERHIWSGYLDQAESVRLLPENKALYKLRKETIERVFADCKENYGFKFIRMRGLEKMEMVAAVTFSSANIVKMARRLERMDRFENSTVRNVSTDSKASRNETG